jgi:hypothetical protein
MKITKLTRAAICLALFIILLATPSPAKACLCGDGYSPSEAFMDADAVFTGKVVAVSNNYSVDSPLDRLLSRISGKPIYVWGSQTTFLVFKSWKTVGTTSVTVQQIGISDCEYSFNWGDDYLVYAQNTNSSTILTTHRCSRTTRVSPTTEDLSYLNPMPTLPLTPIYNYSWLYFAGTVLFVIAISAWAVIVLMRRRQRQKIGDHP